MHANANVTLLRLHDLNPGESCVYYVGDLGFDRQQDGQQGREADQIGDGVWNQYIAGKLLLTCKRLKSSAKDVFRGEYIATKTLKTRPVQYDLTRGARHVAVTLG